jgi:hypothetical protein
MSDRWQCKQLKKEFKSVTKDFELTLCDANLHDIDFTITISVDVYFSYIELILLKNQSTRN